MCEPISIGIAIGATVGAISSAVQGQNVLKGALMGGLMGGVTGGMGGLAGGGAGGIGGSLGFSTSTSFINAVGSSVTQAGVAGLVATTAASSFLTNALSPDTPEYYNYQQQLYTPNSQPSTVTGSGGKQAAFSLAESVRRAKKRKLTQEDVSDLSIDTSSFASEGLQFA